MNGIIIERTPALSLKETFQVSRERIADMGEYDDCIILRCTFSELVQDRQTHD